MKGKVKVKKVNKTAKVLVAGMALGVMIVGGVVSVEVLKDTGGRSDNSVVSIIESGDMRASYGTVEPELSSGYFLNQLTYEEYENLRDTKDFRGFLYIGWTECKYCEIFSPILQDTLSEIGKLDNVRNWEISMHWEGDTSRALMESFGVKGVPALLYFTEGGNIIRYNVDTNNIDLEDLKAFLNK
jgi:hypothetical protein